jgi:hypothetical protein
MESQSVRKENAKAKTVRFLRRIENLLIIGGILAVATGILLATRGADVLLATSCIILGVGLFSGPMSRRVGWVLTSIAVLLFVIALFV